MIRSNVDLIAVSVLIAGMAVCSVAKKIEIQDVFSNRAVVMERAIKGPTIRVVSLLPVFSCSRP